MSDQLDAEQQDDVELPAVLVFGMTGGVMGATIDMIIDPEGANAAEQRRTQLVMGRDQDELSRRCVAVLVSEFGLSQEDAEMAVNDAVPLAPAGGGGANGDYVPTGGGRMTGPLVIDGPGNDLTVTRSDTGEQVIVNAPHIYLSRPQFNAAFFLRGGAGGDFWFQDQATGDNIQITDLANGTLAGLAPLAAQIRDLEGQLSQLLKAASKA